MIKRFLSILLAVCMLACFAPVDAYAIVGAVNSETEEVATRQRQTYSNYKVSWIENEHIRLYFVEQVTERKNYMVTVPARTKASAREAVQMVKKGVYQSPYFTANGKEIPYDTRDVSVVNDELTVKYTFKPYTKVTSKYKRTYEVTTTYRIVKLDEGKTTGYTSAGMLTEDDADSGRTYGIKADVDVGYQGTPGYGDDLNLQFCTKLKNFNKMGHEKVSEGATVYMSSATGDSDVGYQHSESAVVADLMHVKTSFGWRHSPSSGYGSSGEGITELFTKGYSWANPFAATSSLYTGYVTGHDGTGDYRDSLPEYFSVKKDGDVTLELNLELMGSERAYLHNNMLWGFRDLYTEKDDTFTPNDTITVSQSARHLGIYKNDDGYQAIPAASESELDENAKTYGTKIAAIRGNYHEENGRYVFTNGVAALSKSITAVWTGAGGSFSVGKDGSFETNNVNLNTPTFKFYQPKDAAQKNLTIASGENGLIVTMDPDSNDAVMTTNIPGTEISVEKATVKVDGNISFEGNAEFQIFKGAEFTMQELGYGYQGKDFKVNGIRATGKIDTTEMLGLEMASLEGEIDTFMPRYHFSMELNVFDLFESEAELELMRSNLTGTLMPNKLYFYAGSSVAKVPLVPPVVVANITGAGGGFDNLAKTFNGDFFAIPPLNLSITGKGEVLNTLEGKATYTFGPAYFKLEGEEVKILKKLNLIDDFTIEEGVQGETRNYKGTNYTGLKAFGKASVHASVPQSSKVIRASGDLSASVFSGMNSYKNPTSVYVNADMNGGIKGSLHAPKNWPLIGGVKLGSTGFDFYLGASSVVPVRGTNFNGAVNAAFKNFRVYGGAKKEADWKIGKYRVWYIFPENNAGIKTAWLWKKLPEWKWEDHRPSGYSAEYNENDAVAVMDANMDMLGANVTTGDDVALLNAVNTNSVCSKNIELTGNEGQSLSKDATVVMMVTPADGTDMQAFAESLTVSKDGNNLALTLPSYNAEDEITNESEINVFATQNALGKDCVLVGLGDHASIGDQWTVTSDVAEFNLNLNASMPFDSLSVSLNGQTVSGNVENPDSDAKYVLATYFGDESGKAQYAIEYQDITDPSAISAMIPNQGTMVATGDYYVTASLLSKNEITIENEDGSTEQDEVLLPVDTVALGQVHYQNTAQPDAPATAAIKPVGNEIMEGSWNEVANADGYRVTIYQEKSGSFVDTGKTYRYDAADIKASNIDGVSYDAATGTFSLDMALTVKGDAIDENQNASGNTTTSELEAGQNYKIGVQAYNYLTDETGEKIANALVYSEVTKSNDAVLPEYTPLTLKAEMETSRGSGNYTSHDVTEENGVFSCVAGAGNNNRWYLQVTNQENENAAYTLTRVDTDQVIDAAYDGYWNIDNTDITGSVMFRIDAAVDKGTYTDLTTKYLLVEKDDTAPMLSLDQTVVYANKDTGDYTITGLTEPNGTVCLNEEDWDGNLQQAATADENGRFSYSGQLELTYDEELFDEEGNPVLDENGDPVMHTVRNENGMFLLLVAEDTNGNRSAAEAVVVTLEDHDWETDYTVDQEPTCENEGMKSIHCKTCDAVKDEQTIPVNEHDFGEDPISYTAPTATKNGSVTYQCVACQTTETIEIPATELSVAESVTKLSEAGLAIPGWSWDSEKDLLPGTVTEATASHKLTENRSITTKIQVKVFCSATSANHTLGTDDAAVIRCTGILSAFHGLTVDGKALTEGTEYTVESGSTIVTFKADYLNTLSAGTHKVVLNYDSGEVEAELLISEKTVITCDHTYGETTYTWSEDHSQCTATRTCTKCEQKETGIGSVTSMITKNAECTVEGERAYTAIFADEAFETQIWTETIPALGHNWDKGKITTQPTKEKAGIRTYTCERCGTTKTEDVAKISVSDETNVDKGSATDKTEATAKISGTDKTEKSDKKTSTKGSVRTDDNARMMFWITILILSAGTGMATIAVRRKMRRK